MSGCSSFFLLKSSPNQTLSPITLATPSQSLPHTKSPSPSRATPSMQSAFGRVVGRALQRQALTTSQFSRFHTSQFHTPQFNPNQFQYLQRPTAIPQQAFQAPPQPKFQLAAPQLNLSQFKYLLQQPQKISARPALNLNVGVVEEEGVAFTSVLRKRRVKMNRHKLKKRRKKQRFLTRKATK